MNICHHCLYLWMKCTNTIAYAFQQVNRVKSGWNTWPAVLFWVLYLRIFQSIVGFTESPPMTYLLHCSVEKNISLAVQLLVKRVQYAHLHSSEVSLKYSICNYSLVWAMKYKCKQSDYASLRRFVYRNDKWTFEKLVEVVN